MDIYIHLCIFLFTPLFISYPSNNGHWEVSTPERCAVQQQLFPIGGCGPGIKIFIYRYRCIYIPTRVSVSESSDRLSKASALVASHGSGSQSDDSGSSDKRLVVSSLCSGRETRHGERLLYHLSSFCPLTLSVSLSLR